MSPRSRGEREAVRSRTLRCRGQARTRPALRGWRLQGAEGQRRAHGRHVPVRRRRIKQGTRADQGRRCVQAKHRLRLDADGFGLGQFEPTGSTAEMCLVVARGEASNSTPSQPWKSSPQRALTPKRVRRPFPVRGVLAPLQQRRLRVPPRLLDLAGRPSFWEYGVELFVLEVRRTRRRDLSERRFIDRFPEGADWRTSTCRSSVRKGYADGTNQVL